MPTVFLPGGEGYQVALVRGFHHPRGCSSLLIFAVHLGMAQGAPGQ